MTKPNEARCFRDITGSPACGLGRDESPAGPNPLRSEDPDRPQFVAIDTGVAFDIAVGGMGFGPFVPHFDRLRLRSL